MIKGSCGDTNEACMLRVPFQSYNVLTLETDRKRSMRRNLPSSIHLLYAFGSIFLVFEFHQYDNLWMIFTNLNKNMSV
jgi:hypothetical protein